MADFTAPSDFTFKHTEQVDVPNISANDMKAYLDSQAKELRDYFINTFLAEIKATTDGTAGADKIGASAISGLTGETVQAILEALNSKTFADASTTGKGVVELATDAEVTAGTSTTHAVTPAGVKVELDKKALASDLTTMKGSGAIAEKADLSVVNAHIELKAAHNGSQIYAYNNIGGAL